MGPLSAMDAPSLRQPQARNGPTLLEARQGRLPDGVGVWFGGTKARRAKTQLTVNSGVARVILNKWLTG